MTDLVTIDEAMAYLQLTELPPELPMLITNISAAIEAHTGCYFTPRDVTDWLDSKGDDMLFLSKFPIIGTPTVIDTTTGDAVGDWISYTEAGFLWRPAGWGTGRRRWKVDYTAGFEEPPPDVKQACLEWVVARYNQRDPGLKQERLGDYSYTRDDSGGMPANVKAALSLYLTPRGC